MKNLLAFMLLALSLGTVAGCAAPAPAAATAVPASTLPPTATKLPPTAVVPTIAPTQTAAVILATTAPNASHTINPTAAPLPSNTVAPTQPSVVIVHVRDFEWVPNSITIKKGTTVQWISDGPSKHQVVTSDWEHPGPDGYSGKALSPGDTDQFTFNVPGTVMYFCGFHGPSMSAQIIITE